MRIAMVSEHASPLAALGGVDAGGQNVHVAELSAALVRRGHEVAVYTRRDNPDVPERLRTEDGYEVVQVDAGPAKPLSKDVLLPFMGEFGARMDRDWRTWRPEVAHAHFWMSGLASLDAARSSHGRGEPVPVVQTFRALGVVKRRHLGDADTSPPERSWLERALARRVDLVLATCPDEAAELIALGVDMNRVTVIPSGVDLNDFRPDGETEPIGRRPRIAIIGRLVPRKGVDLAITAVSLLRTRGLEVELHIVGGAGGSDQSEADRLKALAVELGVADAVIFRGAVPQVHLPAILRSCTAVLCVPWYEPFGIVPLEAMACGIPVIAAAVGGLQDSVVDGMTGLLVPPHDAQRIAEAVEVLLLNPAVAAGLGKAGRRRVERGYSWDYVAELTEAAYSSVWPVAQPGSGRVAASGVLH